MRPWHSRPGGNPASGLRCLAALTSACASPSLGSPLVQRTMATLGMLPPSQGRFHDQQQLTHGWLVGLGCFCDHCAVDIANNASGAVNY